MADGAHSEDELARTATAPGSPGPVGPAPDLGSTLGRYRLERTLGEGGMGVVHAAFDPDLERRVALKVLRATDSDEANKRLLREARAMARLTHANVVTVHEVGSANGRDYVAMELVDGGTLAEWLRAAKRTPEEILNAFVAAGRGLAAAHAAGLVHRDFKPHNVLRRGDGRVCVTDFGLARESGPQTSDLGPQTSGSEVRGPRSEVPLTLSGSVLGTPAYMAPEQWTGGTVGPAADQFAFCVALWEALTGERPFHGATLDDLKREVAGGTATLDASRLPRRLRQALRRGLDPDPAKRWPNMDALLVALTRAARWRGTAFAIGGGAALVAIGLYVALAGQGDACAPSLLDAPATWSIARATGLATADQAPGAEAIATDFSRWHATRADVCRAAKPERPAQLACLDGVGALIAAQARALAAVRDAPHAEPGALLVDPRVCDVPHPPRIVATVTPERQTALAAMLASTISEARTPPAQADALIAKVASDPCAAVLARLLAANTRQTSVERKRDLEEADSAAQRCGDDRLIAEVAFNLASTAIDQREPDLSTKLERAEGAAATVMQPDLRAALDELRAAIAQRTDHMDEAFTRLEAARTGYAARGRWRAELRARLQLEEMREVRARPDEIAQVSKHLADWRAEAIAKLGATDPVVHELEAALGEWQLVSGDVVGAHARLLANARQLPLEHETHASGRVVDEHGAPVAGATVYAGSSLTADSIGMLPNASVRTATTRADGTFEIAKAEAEGAIVAQLGDLRSRAAKVGDGVTLALAPTSHIDGHVDLHGEAPTNVTIIVRDPTVAVGEYTVIAPAHADGSFSLDGVARGDLVVHAVVRRLGRAMLAGTTIHVDGPSLHGVQLAVPKSQRVVHVIARSTVGMALTHAEVIVMPGNVPSSNVAALQHTVQSAQQRSATPIEREHAPKEVLERAKPGDVYVTVPEAPEGVASACAIGMPTDTTDPDLWQKVANHLDKLEVRCVPIGEHDDVVVVEVPPWPRFD